MCTVSSIVLPINIMRNDIYEFHYKFIIQNILLYLLQNNYNSYSWGKNDRNTNKIGALSKLWMISCFWSNLLTLQYSVTFLFYQWHFIDLEIAISVKITPCFCFLVKFKNSNFIQTLLNYYNSSRRLHSFLWPEQKIDQM